MMAADGSEKAGKEAVGSKKHGKKEYAGREASKERGADCEMGERKRCQGVDTGTREKTYGKQQQDGDDMRGNQGGSASASLIISKESPLMVDSKKSSSGMHRGESASQRRELNLANSK